ncbi:MAG: hypothetical protein OXI26_13220 [bacterium]|nr:hypothetical protein [bacterium]
MAPILQSLGWDPYGPEVLYELPVGGKGSGGRADIALKSSDRIVALIEAKAPGADLRSHVGQVLGYAFHEGVDICVLTTGLEWWLYLPRESGPPPERRFAVLRIADDPVEQLLEDFHAFLSKEMLVNGDAESRAKAVRKAGLEAAQLNKEIPGIWTQMLKEPDDELVELLSKRIYEEVNLRPTKPQVVAALQGSPIPSAAIPADPSAPTPSPTQPQKSLKPKKPGTGAKPVAMELWGERHEVKALADAFRKVLDILYERHADEFDRVLEIRGHKYPYAARDSEMLSPNGESYNYQQPSSGISFDLWLNAEGFQRRTRQFLVHFGHEPTDFRVLYD